jgi:MFS-type transporter involved in bile tolerance (Atg22 family)
MGFHTLLGRINGLAVIDILGTFIISFLILKFYKKENFENIFLLFIFLCVIGELVHVFLNIQTPFLQKIK